MNKKLIVFAFAISGLTGLSADAAITNVSLTTTAYSQNFDTMTTSATSTLPTGWGFTATGTNAGGDPANPSTALTATSQDAGTTGTGVISSASAGGNYLFVNGVLASGTDKAIGMLNSGSWTSPKGLIFGLTNNTGTTITDLTLTWNDEKYRSGTRQWDWTTGFSTNGGTSYTSAPTGAQTYAADANNTTVSNPPTQIAKSVTLTGLNLASGGTLDFEWILTGLAGSTNGQGLGIDDFTLTATLAPVPEPGTFAAGVLALCGLLGVQRSRLVSLFKRS
jgi:hypothetical protein